MDAKTRAKISASTQDHLEILDIIDDVILTKTGTASIVIQTNAVNFDLLSEPEQDNKIYAFAGLLNSLNFHVQILIKTQRIDISNYLSYLKNESDRPMSEGLKRQLEIYTNFIQNLIVTNEVLDKKFYIVVPYNPNAAMVGARLKVSKDRKGAAEQKFTPQEKARILEQGKVFLFPKRDHILKQLGRMGLIGHQLTNNELIQLFYDIYNPEEE